MRYSRTCVDYSRIHIMCYTFDICLDFEEFKIIGNINVLPV